MRGYVVEEKIRGEVWWWFFTQPLVYSVYWKPDGSRTIEQFLHEQAALARAHAIGNADGMGSASLDPVASNAR